MTERAAWGGALVAVLVAVAQRRCGALVVPLVESGEANLELMSSGLDGAHGRQRPSSMATGQPLLCGRPHPSAGLMEEVYVDRRPCVSLPSQRALPVSNGSGYR